MAAKTSLRILMLSITPFKGGGETHAAKLAQLLTERYELRAIVSNDWLHEQIAALGIPVTSIAAAGRVMRSLQAAFAIVKQCLFFRPDVAHLNGQGEAYFAPLFRLLGVKIVVARHTPLSIVNNRLKRMLVQSCYRLGQKIVCVSPVVRREMEEIVSHDRLTTISNWLTDNEIRQPRQFGPIDRSFRLLFVGRLVEFKGARDLITAMKSLDRCTLEVLGDGPEREDLVNRARGLPVLFRGVVHDCASFYDQADLLVFPSYPLEGQGQTPLEAMARGLPCLMSDIEVSQETSDHGRSAALFRCGDVEDLAQKVEELRDGNRLTKLSQAAFERVLHYYSASVVQPLYFKIFDEVARS